MSLSFSLKNCYKVPLENMFERHLFKQTFSLTAQFGKAVEQFNGRNDDNRCLSYYGALTCLVDTRNIAWIQKIEKMILEKPYFFEVDGGYLGGKNDVIKLLRAKSYKVQAIKL